MNDQDKLLEAKQAASDKLEDLEFERFVVGMGCDPKTRDELDAEIRVVVGELSAIDAQLSACEAAARLATLRANPASWTKSFVDDEFNSLVKDFS